MKRVAVLLVGVLAVILLPLAAGAQGMPPTLVETGRVTTMEFHDQITLVGKTEARSSSKVVAEVSGRILRIDAAEGVRVSRGHVLVSVDPRRTRFALDAKRAQVAQAQAAADLAAKNLARTEDLHGRELATDGDYDRDIAEEARTREVHNQLSAELKSLELDLAQCTVRAPFDGYTVRKMVDVGEGVAAGTPVYELVDLSTIKVTVDLPERHFGEVTVGSAVMIRISGGDEPVMGQVAGFAPSASADTHTFPVIITVDNSKTQLGSGMLVRATVSLKDVFSSLAVHKDAIVRQGAQTMIYTVADGKAAPIPVRVGSMKGDYVAISGDGIEEGLVAVVRGNERIFPGSPVRTADGEPGAGGAPGEGAPTKDAPEKATTSDDDPKTANGN